METIKREIEIGNEVIEVEFSVKVVKDNPTYTDEYSTIKGKDYYFAEMIDWNAGEFNDEENFCIDKYLDNNYPKIEDEAIEKFKDEFGE